MDITVTAGEPADSKLVARVAIPADEVKKVVAATYKEIAGRYNFPGFRKGRAPRPVIDSAVGKEAVMADATNELLSKAEPFIINELGVVPVGELDFGEDLQPVVDKQDYEVEVTVTLIPTAELSSYDPVDIQMPPAEATDAEVASQLDLLMSYQARFEDGDENTQVASGDFVNVDIEDIENASELAGEGRMLPTGSGMLPQALEEALVGMKPAGEKEVEYEGADGSQIKMKVKVNDVKVKTVPELTDEYVSDVFGFDNIDALKEALKKEIQQDKDQNLPALKEDRAVAALEKRLELETVPEDYVKQINGEITRSFLQDLQASGQTVDSFLKARRVTMDQLLADLQAQAVEHARQSIALDALARHLNVEATQEDVRAEFENVYDEKHLDKALKEFTESGQMPAVRETVKRTKALQWLLDNAHVTEVDEVAEKNDSAE